MKTVLNQNKLSILIFILLAAASFYFYPNLPDSIPTKFDFNGDPTQYSSKQFLAFFMPCIYMSLIIFINVLANVSPQKFSMANSRRTMDIVLFGCGLLFLGIHFGLLLDPSGKRTFSQLFCVGVAFFLTTVGNVLGKTERNFFIGIRVPWTLASEANWKATHRFGGKLMVIFGLMLFCLSAFYPSMPLAIITILVPTIIPVFYSFYFFKYKEFIERE